jgi:hypothetical protein
MYLEDEVFDGRAPIFIVGSTRSGTTLTRSILSSHPNIALADGFHYFVEVANFRKVVPDLRAPGALDRFFELLGKSRHYPHIADLGADLAEVRARLERDPEPTYGKYFLFAMEAYAKNRGAARYGEKTSAHVRYLGALQRMFPNAKILHLVRDPRANVASHLHVPWAARDVVSLAMKWKVAVRAFLDYCARGPRVPENLMEVHYEDLVGDAEVTIRRICDFVGEPFDPRMLDHQDHSGIKVGELPWKTGITKAIYAGAVEKWQHELSGPQIHLIQWLTAREMAHYGYTPIEISAEDKRRAPVQFAREIARWVQYKRRLRAEHQRAGTQYWDETGVYRRLLALLGGTSSVSAPGPRGVSGGASHGAAGATGSVSGLSIRSPDGGA